MRRLVLPTVLIALIAFSAVTVLAQTSWEPEMQLKLKLVGTPRVSPDGKSLVYTVSDAVTTPEKSEFVTQIWMADVATKKNIQLTFGEKSSGNPRWSPDGNWIAFTSNRKDNKNNLYLLSVSGGEAELLTDVKSNISNFEWSPDGKSIAFTMTDPKTEDEEKNDKGKNDFRWVDENLKMSRLYLLSLQKDAAGKREPRKLTSGNYNVNAFDWSPDSSRIVFSHVRTPNANDWPTADISIIDLASSQVSVLANTPAAEESPLYSPDGSQFSPVIIRPGGPKVM